MRMDLNPKILNDVINTNKENIHRYIESWFIFIFILIQTECNLLCAVSSLIVKWLAAIASEPSESLINIVN